MKGLWKKSKIARLAALGVAALGLLSAAPARAGEYVLTYEFDGDLYVNTHTPDTVP